MRVVTVRSFGSLEIRASDRREDRPGRSKCDDISSFVGVRPKKSTRGRQERRLLERGKRGRIGFEWTQHSMFYRRSIYVGWMPPFDYLCARSRCEACRSFVVCKIGAWEEWRAAKDEGYAELPFFLSLSRRRVELPSVRTKAACTGGTPSQYLHGTTHFPLVILRRWSFRVLSDEMFLLNYSIICPILFYLSNYLYNYL